MKSVRSILPLIICLYVQLSVCPLGSTSGSTSLWGKKLKFLGRPCLWQLRPDAVVPALGDLTLCMLLRRTHTTEWTGFAYKAPGARHVELGLGGKGTKLAVWLFGLEWQLDRELKLHHWYSVCITWSGQARRLRVYVGGTAQYEASLNATQPHQLAPNGTLTLGVSHYVDANGAVQAEQGNNLLGEIGLFRMWAREWSGEELRGNGCADGDVVSWDLRQWKYSCPPEPDISLQCAWSAYKIKMLMAIVHSPVKSGNCSASPEKITGDWLRSIFPLNISIRGILLSSPSRTCQVVNNSAALYVRQPQESRVLLNPTCDVCFSCEVHVNVDPAASVEVVQMDIAALLNSSFSDGLLSLTADPNSISIVPAESFTGIADPTPTASAGLTSAEAAVTQPARPTNVSATGDPPDVNDTSVGPDIFFRLNLTLNVAGSPTNPKDMIKKLLKEKLEENSTMVVVNLNIMETAGRNMQQHGGPMIPREQRKEYRCTFHVQEYNIKSVEESIALINDTLRAKYENGTVVIETVDLAIKQIVPENCLEELTSTIYGEYFWPEAFPQVNQEMGCRVPESNRAYRLCKLDIETDTTSWADPDMTNCNPLATIPGLDNVTVTTQNAAEVVEMIQDLVNVQLGNAEELSSSELDTVVEKLNEVVDIGAIQPALGANIVSIVGNILLSKTDVTPVADIVLNMTEKMGENMDFPGESVSLTAPSLALAMINADPEEFRGLTFGVSSTAASQEPKIFVNRSFVSEPPPGTDATISLPPALHSSFPPAERHTTRVQFQFYGTQDLFQDPLLINATHHSWTLNSYIVSASINNSHVANLEDKVMVTLCHQKAQQPGDQVKCVFWDFQNNGGQGGWNSRGCEIRNISSYQTSCLCDHLTHFAVLLDVSRSAVSEADSQILTVISYLGCGISSIFLGITLLTYVAFEKLRRDHPSKIHINLSTALLGLSMLFLLDSWLASFSNHSLCIATAATLHYFLLASFTWMGLEAVHMYLALVKVFNIYVPLYILKFCAVGWGVPLVIVTLVLAIDKDAYGSAVPEDAAVVLHSTEPFCWLQDDVLFYVTVVAFVLLILLCNCSVFIVVLIQIRQMRANKPSANSRSSLQDLKAVASLTVLLGLTWSVGFFSFGPGRLIMMYLFTIFNTLQGFFVFLFHCLMKENVRKQWRIHLCCGRFRLSKYSDWSGSATAGGRCKKNNLVKSVSAASDDTSTIRKISGSSTGLGPNDHKGA